jgi:hypothetical protein
MANRQDIDALLVGALYGELDVAERARLDAHLSSHPEDRAELDAMERTRAQVRRGLADMPQAEPSPSISQLLLRAAKDGAPRAVVAAEVREESAWARFVAWLVPVARHPAFATAAVVLLVAGTATALWMRDAGKVSEPTQTRPAAASAAPTHDEGGADSWRSSSGSASASGSASSAAIGAADKYKANGYRVDLAQDERQAKAAEAPKTVAKDDGAARRDRHTAAAAAAAGKNAPTDTDGMVVQPHGAGSDVSIQEALDAEDDANMYNHDATEKKGGLGAGSGSGGGATGTVGPAPSVTSNEPKPADPAHTEWAQGAHQRLIQLVADGKCPDAGRLGAEIKDKAPEYFAANIANDRRVRQCKQYIETQAKKKADKAYKSRAQHNASGDSLAEPAQN